MAYTPNRPHYHDASLTHALFAALNRRMSNHVPAPIDRAFGRVFHEATRLL
jgi:hypothetical protein